VMSSAIERAITILRLHKTGRFAPLPRLGFVAGPGGFGTSSTGHTGDLYGFNAYAVTEADRTGLEAIAHDLVSAGVRARRHVESAVRRFSFAGERRRPDDRLLDLMIAAESLFLGHLPEREGELRFRLSLHAAHLIGQDLSERKEVARLMRLAYDTRSAIVHGGIPDPAKWGSSASHPLTLEEFADRIETLMRRGLQVAVSLSAQAHGNVPFFDWDDAVYARATNGRV
jgi:hypothetical protein